MRLPMPTVPWDPAAAQECSAGWGKIDPPAEEEAALHGCWDRRATLSCCSPVQFSPYLSVEDEDFWVGVLNLHMFCSSPTALDMVVAVAGGCGL